jgi:hypothetical protein
MILFRKGISVKQTRRLIAAGGLKITPLHAFSPVVAARLHTLYVMWNAAITVISHVARLYNIIWQRTPHFLITPQQKSLSRR